MRLHSFAIRRGLFGVGTAVPQSHIHARGYGTRDVFATPAEIGKTCALLASPLASHVTGAVLNVDGGVE